MIVNAEPRLKGLVPTCLAMSVAVAAFIVGAWWNTAAAGGSDSHCYLQQARLLAAGSARLREPLGLTVPWPAADLTFAPAGFVPSDQEAGASVPICSPGFSLIMAPLARLGPAGEQLAFHVVPLLGAWTVWLTFVLGRRLGGPAAGLIAAVFLAASPIFVYQIVQPMSDVPAAAWWAAATVATTAGTTHATLLGGLAAGLAVLTRPNLGPLAVVLCAGLMVAAARAGGPAQAAGAAMRFAAGSVPGLTALAVLQWWTYGSPLRTGYGDPSTLFAVSHIVPNAQRYVGWMIATHGPLPGLAIAAPFLQVAPDARRDPSNSMDPSSTAWLLLAVSATTLACYLPYLEFDVWWYLRFLLPALPLVSALSAAVLVRLTERLPPAGRGPVLAVITLGSAAWWIGTAHDRRAFDLQRMERHFVDAGHAAARLPEGAVVMTVADSGGVRFHGRRSALLWESLDPDWFDRALDVLRAGGRPPYLLLEANEVEAFRARFRGHTVLAELDWPPVLQVGTTMKLYDPADRARFHRGERVATEQLWSPVPPPAEAVP